MCINKFIATTKTKINNFTYVLSFDSDFNISISQKKLIKNLKIKMPTVKIECTGTDCYYKYHIREIARMNLTLKVFVQLSGNNQAPQYSYSKKKINNHNRTYIYLTGSGIYII